MDSRRALCCHPQPYMAAPRALAGLRAKTIKTIKTTA
jgi:hypothetical protein